MCKVSLHIEESKKMGDFSDLSGSVVGHFSDSGVRRVAVLRVYGKQDVLPKDEQQHAQECAVCKPKFERAEAWLNQAFIQMRVPDWLKDELLEYLIDSMLIGDDQHLPQGRRIAVAALCVSQAKPDLEYGVIARSLVHALVCREVCNFAVWRTLEQWPWSSLRRLEIVHNEYLKAKPLPEARAEHPSFEALLVMAAAATESIDGPARLSQKWAAHVQARPFCTPCRKVFNGLRMILDELLAHRTAQVAA